MEEDSVKSRIFHFMEYKGLSQSKFEKAVGLSNGYLNNLRHSPSTEKLSMILEAFPEINQVWLRSGVGPMLVDGETKTKELPLIPQSAMAGGLAGASTQWERYHCEIFVVPEFADSDYLIRVSGDSMMPDLLPGDIVACHTVPLGRLWFQWGKIYVLDTKQGPLIKKIMPSERDGSVKIVSSNPDYPPFDLEIEEINNVSIVDGFIRR